MTDLADFLLARIAEDEETARAATPGRWYWYNGDIRTTADDLARLISKADTGEWAVEPADGAHIQRHEPGRVLADAAAKRHVVTHELAVLGARWDELPDAERQAQPDWLGKATTTVLRALALPWIDHPDFRQGWAP